MVKSGFRESDDECMLSPSRCEKGLALSLWERVVYEEDVLNVNKQHPKKYILSTGGDYVSSTAFPGVSLYHEGMDLVAVVSDGDDVWRLRVTGPLKNETWSNIGIRWEPFDFDKLKEEKGGLELFVNKQRVGRSFAPLPRPDSSSDPRGKWLVGPAQPKITTSGADGSGEVEHSPPYVFLGCHRNSFQKSFHGFNSAGAAYDELAIWVRGLNINDTHDETDYFDGGYISGYEDVTPDEWELMLDNVPLYDLAQAEMAAILTSRLFFSDDYLRSLMEREDEADVAEASNGTADRPWAGPRFPRTDQQQRDYDRQKQSLRTVEKLVTLRALLRMVRPKDIRRVLTVMDAGSGPLMDTAENRAGWASVHLDPNEVGSIDLLNRLDEYALAFVNSANVQHIESFHPIFDAGRQEMTMHAKTRAMTMSVLKARQSDLMERYGDSFRVSTFFEKHPTNPTEMWDSVAETVDVPTKLFFRNDSTFGCGDFPVTYVVSSVPGFGKMSPVRRNPVSVRARSIKMDSGAVSVKMRLGLDPDDDERDPTECDIDPVEMKYYPVRVYFQLMDHSTSRRKLLGWTDDQIKSDIEVRRCVVYNASLGLHGGWDASLCTTLVSDQTTVVCECAAFGTLAVVAELADAPHWPDEPRWLRIAKFSGIACSTVALAVFSAVILSSPALYDMFHLMHLHTSLSFVCGLVFFAVASCREVCEERAHNIFVATFLQFFFGVICCFVCSEALVFFKAVTSGVIGGKTWSYVLLSYGLPTLSVGFTMFAYGDDYGTDPRCFVGWENATKRSFLVPLMVTIALSFFLALVILINAAFPRTRRASAAEILARQAQGVAVLILVHTLTWAFSYPAVVRFPDNDMPDFWPIFVILLSWLGLPFVLFLGLTSTKFRGVMMGQTNKMGLTSVDLTKYGHTDNTDDRAADFDSFDEESDDDDQDEQDEESGGNQRPQSAKSTVTNLGEIRGRGGGRRRRGRGRRGGGNR